MRATIAGKISGLKKVSVKAKRMYSLFLDVQTVLDLCGALSFFVLACDLVPY